MNTNSPNSPSNVTHQTNAISHDNTRDDPPDDKPPPNHRMFLSKIYELVSLILSIFFPVAVTSDLKARFILIIFILFILIIFFLKGLISYRRKLTTGSNSSKDVRELDEYKNSVITIAILLVIYIIFNSILLVQAYQSTYIGSKQYKKQTSVTTNIPNTKEETNLETAQEYDESEDNESPTVSMTYNINSTFSLPTEVVEYNLSKEDLQNVFFIEPVLNDKLTEITYYDVLTQQKYDLLIKHTLHDGLENSSNAYLDEIDKIRKMDENFMCDIQQTKDNPIFTPGTIEWYGSLPSYKELDNTIKIREDFYTKSFNFNMCNQLFNNYFIYAQEYETQSLNPNAVLYFYCKAILIEEHALEFAFITPDNCSQTISNIKEIYFRMANSPAISQKYQYMSSLISESIDTYIE